MVSWSESKKRGCDNIEILETNSAKGKFWSGSGAGLELDQDGEDESDKSDPRKDEDWKIQRRKSFLKDRESKAQQAKQVKLSLNGLIPLSWLSYNIDMFKIHVKKLLL